MFVYGWNTPGYLPEMEPVECDTFEDAKEGLLDSMRHAANDYASLDRPSSLADALYAAASLVERWHVEALHRSRGELGVLVPFDYAYWIREQE